jgi:hypothetical protein
MFMTDNDSTVTEPETGVCTTERIANELSKCVMNDFECENFISADKTYGYCTHPEHKTFRAISD